MGRWGRPTTARRTPDRTEIIWGMCLITDFRTGGRGKFNLGGQEGETDYSTAHTGSDPNYLWEASTEGNAVVRCEFGHVDDGLRADSSTRFPGTSSCHIVHACNFRESDIACFFLDFSSDFQNDVVTDKQM
jgi:hypothetical protein